MKGVFYEDKAAEFLKLKGYQILQRNFRSRWGEIDIIARDGDSTAFIEVRARSRGHMVSGLESVDIHKQNKIRKAASFYASKNPNRSYRFDVLEIIQHDDHREYNLIKGAFDMQE